MLLGFLLRAYQLNRPLGGGDENEFLLSWAYSPLGFILTRYDAGGHHVFHSVLVRLMILGFGEENEIAIRFPAFLFGVGGLCLLYLLAQRLFACQWTAGLALLIAAVSPVHIYYSQTARGYSLVIFFSIAMVYASIRLLESRDPWKWGSLLTLCGFLSVYTIPTNVYFVVALAVWLVLVLLIPLLGQSFGIDRPARNRFLVIFLTAFSIMCVLSLLAHGPFLREMVVAASEYYTPRIESSFLKLGYAIVGETFQGPMAWFLPFLVVGVVWGKLVRPAYRLLPVCIFLIPFAVNQLIGFTGFARNYLFNWPLFMIFLAAGLIRAGQFVESRMQGQGRFAGAILGALCVLVSLKIVVWDRFSMLPSTGVYSYKHLVEKYSDPLDLIVINDSRDYLYARSVYLKNLKNIFLLNKLSGVKFIAASSSAIGDFGIREGGKGFPVFKNLIPLEGLKGEEIKSGFKIFSLTGSESAYSLLPEDFESRTQWQTIRGEGQIKLGSTHKLEGENTLLLEANPKTIMIAETLIPRVIDLKQNALIILIYGSYNQTSSPFGIDNVLVVPSIVVRDLRSEQTHQLRVGSVNIGIRSEMREAETQAEGYNWKLLSYVGYIPPGLYSLALQLVAPKGQSIFYDGLRLFIF